MEKIIKQAESVEATLSQDEKKVQVSIGVLKELAENKKLLDKFIEIVGEENMKSTMAISIARREIKQLELEVK